jgi:hypothetical protein
MDTRIAIVLTASRFDRLGIRFRRLQRIGTTRWKIPFWRVTDTSRTGKPAMTRAWFSKERIS